MLSFETATSEIIFFLGAGASIRAGVSGVKGMVIKGLLTFMKFHKDL
jgi:hypothetical protein